MDIDTPLDDDLASDEIEAAYLRALEASEEITDELEEVAADLDEPLLSSGPAPDASTAEKLAAAAPFVEVTPASEASVGSLSGTLSLGATTEPPAETIEAEGPRVTPSQVIEAALFMGGTPFTARKLCGLLRGSFDAKFVEDAIDELNTRYSQQSRPYFIRLATGGYRLELRPEFERYRHRVYGTGPREVKLSQEVLEILAVVAYKQPISQAELEALGKKNAGSVLRQLLRRELVSLTRGESPKDVRYHTTSRFLQLFGLASLDDLPQTEDVAMK